MSEEKDVQIIKTEQTMEEIDSVEELPEDLKESRVFSTSFIPLSFKKTGRPQILVLEDLDKFESKDRYCAYIKAGDTVKLFKLTEPITEGQEVSDRYAIQYEAIVYKGQTMQRLYRERLDANYDVIQQENLQ